MKKEICKNGQEKLKLSDIKSFVHQFAKIEADEDIRSKNVWAHGGKLKTGLFHCACIGVKTFVCYLEMAYDGTILNVVHFENVGNPFEPLIGNKLDLTTVEERVITDHMTELGRTSKVVGLIVDDEFKELQESDVVNPVVEIWDRVERKMKPSESEAADTFKAICRKYQENISEYMWLDGDGDKWIVTFKIGDQSFSATLWRFFDYKLTVTLHREHKGHYKGLSLSENKISLSEYLPTIEEVLSGSHGTRTKLLFLFQRGYYDSRGYNFNTDQDVPSVEVRYSSSHKGDPQAKYTFNVDFDKKMVSVAKPHRVAKSVIDQVERMNEKLRSGSY